MRTRMHPRYSDYAVTEDGNVYRRYRHGVPINPEPVKQHSHPKGYRTVSLCFNGSSLNQFVHRLVLQAFAGEQPECCEASHLDGNPKNNNIDNLIWESRKENHARKKEHGTHQGGENNPYSKLSNHDVQWIKFLLTLKTKQRLIARCFCVSEQIVSDIKLGKRRAAC